ncbi:MAG: anthranilate phosphoribosyltransferase [Chloroflexota bacterium]
MAIREAIAEVINGRNLTFEQAETTMNQIMSGDATQAQIGSYLTALRMKGETIDEIAGSAKSMLEHVIPVNVKMGSPDEMLIDTVGTGGDGKHTFNISTTSAFVVAGAGKKVAKHGNRAASSRSGSADVLMALGANLDLNADQVAECVNQAGIGFLYAVKHHPAMRHAIGPRRELGQRTIFNVLGPLTNPAGATHLLVGVFAGYLTEPLAHVLGRLGKKAAYVVHGADGLDELSTTGVNQVSYVKDGQVNTFDMDPQDYGIARGNLDDMIGGEPEDNAQITRDILSGKDTGPRRDIVLLNAGATLGVKDNNIAAGIAQAKDSIDSGAALKTLDAWVEATNSFSS